MDSGSIVALLKNAKTVLATAESCTGGLLASQVTDIAGASEVLWGSWVVYDDSAKAALGVSTELLARYGAVSREVAAALVEAGARRLEEALDLHVNSGLISDRREIAVIATTGVAGPSGGTPATPVGLCYIGLSFQGRTQVIAVQAPAEMTRIERKNWFSEKALELLATALHQKGKTSS